MEKSSSNEMSNLNDIAVSLAKEGKLEVALTLFERALMMTTGLWLNRGNCLCELKRYKDALKCYDIASVINPQYPDVWMSKANALRHLGKYKDALISYEKALELTPPFASGIIWFNKACLYSLMRRKEDALESLRKALELNPEEASAEFERNESFALFRNDPEFKRLVRGCGRSDGWTTAAMRQSVPYIT